MYGHRRILSSANKIKATVIVIFILPARPCIIRYLFQAAQFSPSS